MELKLDIEEFMQEVQYRTLVDVRTPSEFLHGHIPGAVNLPLFSDEERAEVGTLYKQVSPQKAFARGLELAGAKMSWYVKEGAKLAPERRVAVHCWRGGKRSGSIAWLLENAGFEAVTLRGGYKAYRNYILQHFSAWELPLLVIGGTTGSGKTEVLRRLSAMGEQVVDLEQLARHKGSAFGALGEEGQPTVEQFENDLHLEISKLDFSRRIWIENESKSIGKVYLPDAFWAQKIRSPLIHLEVPLERRISNLIETYAQFPKEQLRNSFEKISRRLGGLRLKNALEALEQDDFATAVKIALEYYDKTYNHCIENGKFEKVLKIETGGRDAGEMAKHLVNFANEKGLK